MEWESYWDNLIEKKKLRPRLDELDELEALFPHPASILAHKTTLNAVPISFFAFILSVPLFLFLPAQIYPCDRKEFADCRALP